MKRIVTPVFAAIALLICASSCAQPEIIVPEKKVKEAIIVLANIVDSPKFQKFGVKSKAELKALKPGKQFRTYFIRLDDLQKYQAGHDAQEIVREYASVEVALVDQKGRIVTSIQFNKKDTSWVPARYGSTPEMSVLTRIQDSIPKNAIIKGNMIRVPSLNMCFMSVPNHGTTDFFMLEKYADLSYQKGEKVKSAKIMELLMPLANKAANSINTN